MERFRNQPIILRYGVCRTLNRVYIRKLTPRALGGTDIPAPMRNLLSISRFSRWLLASIANVVHYSEHAERAATAALPEKAKLVPGPATMEVWEEVFDAAGLIVGAAAHQLRSVFEANPMSATFGGIAMLWLVIETTLLARTAVGCLRKRRG